MADKKSIWEMAEDEASEGKTWIKKEIGTGTSAVTGDFFAWIENLFGEIIVGLGKLLGNQSMQNWGKSFEYPEPNTTTIPPGGSTNATSTTPPRPKPEPVTLDDDKVTDNQSLVPANTTLASQTSFSEGTVFKKGMKLPIQTVLTATTNSYAKDGTPDQTKISSTTFLKSGVDYVIDIDGTDTALTKGTVEKKGTVFSTDTVVPTGSGQDQKLVPMAEFLKLNKDKDYIISGDGKTLTLIHDITTQADLNLRTFQDGNTITLLRDYTVPANATPGTSNAVVIQTPIKTNLPIVAAAGTTLTKGSTFTGGAALPDESMGIDLLNLAPVKWLTQTAPDWLEDHTIRPDLSPQDENGNLDRPQQIRNGALAATIPLTTYALTARFVARPLIETPNYVMTHWMGRVGYKDAAAINSRGGAVRKFTIAAVDPATGAVGEQTVEIPRTVKPWESRTKLLKGTGQKNVTMGDLLDAIDNGTAVAEGADINRAREAAAAHAQRATTAAQADTNATKTIDKIEDLRMDTNANHIDHMSNAQDIINAMNANFSKTIAELTGIRGDIGKLGVGTGGLQTAVDDLKAAVERNSNVTNRNTRITDQNTATTNANNTATTNLNTAISKLDAATKDAAAKTAVLTTKLEDSIRATNTLAEKTQKLRDATAASETQIKELKDAQLEANRLAGEVKTAQAENTTALQAVKDQAIAMQASIAGNTEAQAALKTVIDTNNGLLETASTTIGGKLDQLQKSADSLTNSIKQNTDAIRDNDSGAAGAVKANPSDSPPDLPPVEAKATAPVADPHVNQPDLIMNTSNGQVELDLKDTDPNSPVKRGQDGDTTGGVAKTNNDGSPDGGSQGVLQQRQMAAEGSNIPANPFEVGGPRFGFRGTIDGTPRIGSGHNALSAGAVDTLAIAAPSSAIAPTADGNLGFGDALNAQSNSLFLNGLGAVQGVAGIYNTLSNSDPLTGRQKIGFGIDVVQTGSAATGLIADGRAAMLGLQESPLASATGNVTGGLGIVSSGTQVVFDGIDIAQNGLNGKKMDLTAHGSSLLGNSTLLGGMALDKAKTKAAQIVAKEALSRGETVAAEELAGRSALTTARFGVSVGEAAFIVPLAAQAAAMASDHIVSNVDAASSEYGDTRRQASVNIGDPGVTRLYVDGLNLKPRPEDYSHVPNYLHEHPEYASMADKPDAIATQLRKTSVAALKHANELDGGSLATARAIDDTFLGWASNLSTKIQTFGMVDTHEAINQAQQDMSDSHTLARKSAVTASELDGDMGLHMRSMSARYQDYQKIMQPLEAQYGDKIRQVETLRDIIIATQNPNGDDFFRTAMVGMGMDDKAIKAAVADKAKYDEQSNTRYNDALAKATKEIYSQKDKELSDAKGQLAGITKQMQGISPRRRSSKDQWIYTHDAKLQTELTQKITQLQSDMDTAIKEKRAELAAAGRQEDSVEVMTRLAKLSFSSEMATVEKMSDTERKAYFAHNLEFTQKAQLLAHDASGNPIPMKDDKGQAMLNAEGKPLYQPDPRLELVGLSISEAQYEDKKKQLAPVAPEPDSAKAQASAAVHPSVTAMLSNAVALLNPADVYQKFKDALGVGTQVAEQNNQPLVQDTPNAPAMPGASGNSSNERIV